ncbi:SMI1/KNR4 family protein [Enterococcus plantarum]|uniref:SMI1/KNR4 family protein n=1 Tax=Enterococcus plantarum TaxID=1077675 RepID=A0A2W4BQ32_9ENTE|nr:SMI1/KNR4 family protein [Enterococcus plantarum]PZL75099.1 SMI1/KNR4 family protein [Enterococcus plantarum]PZL75992.1 SMI1/KNR4 family protein [Enterococcus plantarum]
MFEVKQDSILVPPSDELIEKFERFYRVALPSDYVEFLKKYNGAVPITNVFSTEKNEYLIERFLCLLSNEDRDNLENISWSEIRVVLTDLDARLIDDEDLLGMNIIPIASLFAGDFICLDFRESEKNPSICVWFHEESDEFSPVVERISSNFTDFLNNLHK